MQLQVIVLSYRDLLPLYNSNPGFSVLLVLLEPNESTHELIWWARRFHCESANGASWLPHCVKRKFLQQISMESNCFLVNLKYVMLQENRYYLKKLKQEFIIWSYLFRRPQWQSNLRERLSVAHKHWRQCCGCKEAGVGVLFLMFLQFHLLSRVFPGMKHFFSATVVFGMVKWNSLICLNNLHVEQVEVQDLVKVAPIHDMKKWWHSGPIFAGPLVPFGSNTDSLVSVCNFY